MRWFLGRLIIVLVLGAAAVLCRAEARQLRDSADRHERFATLRYPADEGDEPSGWLSSILRWFDDESGTRRGVARATAAYWLGHYDALVGVGGEVDRDPDAAALLIAANAAFRASQRSPQPRQAQVQQLDLVLQAYATALKAPVFLPDAAYNYEYVARMREAFARARGNAAAAAEDKTGRAGDLPAGPTIHGHPGGPPPNTKGEEFEIITPMEFGDREAQPEAAPGVKPLRKG